MKSKPKTNKILGVMDWLEEQLKAVWSNARSKAEDQTGIPVLKRMFLGHIELIERHPGLVKVIMSDHIREPVSVIARTVCKVASKI
jgi:hypothetical protein